MNTKKSRHIFLTLLGILGAIALVLFLFNDQSVISSNNIIDSKETTKSAYPGVDIVTEINDEKLYSLAIHYPEFKETFLNEQIQQYVSLGKGEFLNHVEQNRQHLKEAQASLYITFDIYPIDKDLYSIVFNMESYVVGANGQQSSKIFLVDVNSNRFIQQTEIIIDNEVNRDKLFHLLLKKFEASEEYRDFLFKDYLKEWINDPHNHFSNMFLTEDFLAFKFDKYLVTAGAAGSPEIYLPLEEVREFLREDWQKRLDIPKENDEALEPDKVPEPNEQEDSEKDIGDNISPNKKRVALTFDDGPHNTNTPKILELLDKYNAKATFFMLGTRVDFYPDIAKEIVERGHEPGNHTWHHRDLTTLSKAEINLEIERTNVAIKKATGKEPILYRPPYGSINNQVREAVNKPAILWTVDTLDWKSRNAHKVLKEVQKNVEDGSIILMHDIHDTTVEAVALVLEFLDKEGYECVTVSELHVN